MLKIPGVGAELKASILGTLGKIMAIAFPFTNHGYQPILDSQLLLDDFCVSRCIPIRDICVC